MRTNIEDKILKVLFKEEVIAKEMAKILLPEVSFDSYAKEDLTVQDGYDSARLDLVRSIQRMLDS